MYLKQFVSSYLSKQETFTFLLLLPLSLVHLQVVLILIFMHFREQFG